MDFGTLPLLPGFGTSVSPTLSRVWQAIADKLSEFELLLARTEFFATILVEVVYEPA